MVMGTNDVVPFDESIVERPQRWQERLIQSARTGRKQVFKRRGTWRHRAGRRIQAGQLRTKGTDGLPWRILNRVTGVNHTRVYTRPGHIRRYRDSGWVLQRGPQTLVAQKPEELVLDDRPARRGAELFDRRIGDWIHAGRRKEVPCIGCLSIASKGVSRTVNRIGSRLDSDVNHRTRPPAIFRLRVLLGIKFLDGIDGYQRI